jgi:hypothetical protein
LPCICGCDATQQLQEVMTDHSKYDMTLSKVYARLRKLRTRDYALRTMMMISLHHMTPCKLMYKLQGFGGACSIFRVNSRGTTFKLDATSPSTQYTRRCIPGDGNRICKPHQILYGFDVSGSVHVGNICV